MKKVVIGLLGSVLDTGKGAKRWRKWRPTVSICQHQELPIDRLELLYQPKFSILADTVVADLHSVSPDTCVNLIPIELDDAWNFEEVYGALHDFARGYRFDLENEEYLVHITTGSHVAQICLYLLTESRLIPGKLLQTNPPKGRGADVSGSYSIIDLDLSQYDKIASRFFREARSDVSFLKSGIETRNKNFNGLIETIERVAIKSKAPLLLTGPTGAGKSLLARRIYELKKAKRQVSGKFVEINCATIHGDVAMSALFGHVRGAFTGAIMDKPGLLKVADGGILFLDEIAELRIDEQAMLLRALEEKTFLPLGSVKELTSDFQLICGTNRDLAVEVAQGRFREDLLARINLWTFSLPPLIERSEDIEPNIEYELEQFERTTGYHVTFNREARRRFVSFATSPQSKWKANFRDLNAAINRMATLSFGGRITVKIVEEEIERLVTAWEHPASEEMGKPVLSEFLSAEQLAAIDPFEAVQLAYVVDACRSSRSLSEAGRKLFIASRAKKRQVNDADRLRKYLAKYGLEWQSLQVMLRK